MATYLDHEVTIPFRARVRVTRGGSKERWAYRRSLTHAPAARLILRCVRPRFDLGVRKVAV